MLGGIIFQMGMYSYFGPPGAHIEPDLHTAAITVYVALASEFIIRRIYDNPVRDTVYISKTDQDYNSEAEADPMDKKTKLMLISLALSSVFIFIRCVSHS